MVSISSHQNSQSLSHCSRGVSGGGAVLGRCPGDPGGALPDAVRSGTGAPDDMAARGARHGGAKGRQQPEPKGAGGGAPLFATRAGR
jgi:hypothetical protein